MSPGLLDCTAMEHSVLDLPLAGLQRAAGLIVDALLPPRCLDCGAVVEAVGALCQDCWQRLSFIAAPLCIRCGHPFAVDAGALAECGECLASPPPFARARAVFRYDDASRGLILRFKHADHTAAAPAFARWMARAGAELLSEADCIVPVPLHRWRLFHRRYNQAALLANALAKLSGVRSQPAALQRIRHTASQGTMGRRQRQSNVRGAFRLNAKIGLAGQRVILVDDVLTSGATIEECAMVLLDGGANAVDVLTLARVVLGR